MRPAQTPAGSSRLAGAAGALLLQGGFLLLFLASMPALHPPVPLQRELSLILSRRFAPLPSLLQTAPGPSRVAPPPNLSPPSPLITAPLLPEPGVPDFSTRLQALGQALNDCTPEKWGSLTAEQRAHCPRPGAGLALDPQFNLSPPSHAKDEATWREEFDEKHWMPGLCGPDSGGTVVHCQMQQSIAEYERSEDAWYQINRAKAAAAKPPKPPVPPK